MHFTRYKFKNVCFLTISISFFEHNKGIKNPLKIVDVSGLSRADGFVTSELSAQGVYFLKIILFIRG